MTIPAVGLGIPPPGYAACRPSIFTKVELSNEALVRDN